MVPMFSKTTISEQYYTNPFTTVLFSASFGNLGPSEPICSEVSAFVSQGPQEILNLACPNGMRMVKFVGTAFRDSGNCLVSNITFDELTSPNYENCSSLILENTELMQKCNYESSCTLSITLGNFPRDCFYQSENVENQFVTTYAICECKKKKIN